MLVHYKLPLNILLFTFSGCIPQDIRRLVNLQSLHLQANSLVGMLQNSPSHGGKQVLDIFCENYHIFAGDIPSEIGELVQLEELYVSAKGHGINHLSRRHFF